MSARIKVAVAVAAGALLAALAVAGSAPLVRHQASKAADKLGADVDIEGVRLRWGGVLLEGVDVGVRDVPAARVHLDEVDVSLLGGRAVALRGGTVALVGPRDQVVHQIEAWRARRAAGGAGTGGGGTTVSLEKLNITWKNDANAPTETLEARGLTVERAEGVVRLAAEKASVSIGFGAVELLQPRIALSRRADAGYRLHEFGAAGVEAALTLPGPSTDPPVELPAEKRAEPEGRGARWRALAVRAAAAVDAAIEDGAQVHLQNVHARLRRGDDTLNLGPGTLDVTRSAGRLSVELVPETQAVAAGAEPAMTFRLSVPLGPGTDEIVADVKGGAVGLSALGVRDGDFGLFDVAKASLATRAHVVLSGDGRTLTVDGEGKLHQLSIRSAGLSDEPVAGLELAWRGRGEFDLDGRRAKVDDAEVDLGAIRVSARGDYERTDTAHRLHATFDVPLTACQSMLDSTPRGLVPKLAGMRMAGSFGIKGRLEFDTANLDRTYRADWDAGNSCRVTEAPPEINVERFRRAFRHIVYTPDGNPTELESGPGTPDWTPFSSISKFMEVAVLTTEDGGFPRHHGFDHEAIKNSIRENIRKLKFVRGASTISMQLAKNLYLDRTKNLSRKLQEAVLTMYLEQELTKEQILELYFNVIEFGPMIYGIGPAARHYFNAQAADLSLGQALYISSIMPNPKVQHFEAGGAVTASWTSYLHKLMHIANDRHRITDDELEEGLAEPIARGSPASPHGPHAARRSGEGSIDEEAPPADTEWMAP